MSAENQIVGLLEDILEELQKLNAPTRESSMQVHPSAGQGLTQGP